MYALDVFLIGGDPLSVESRLPGLVITEPDNGVRVLSGTLVYQTASERDAAFDSLIEEPTVLTGFEVGSQICKHTCGDTHPHADCRINVMYEVVA